MNSEYGERIKMRGLRLRIDCKYSWDRNLCKNKGFDNAYKVFLGSEEVSGMAALSKLESRLSLEGPFQQKWFWKMVVFAPGKDP